MTSIQFVILKVLLSTLVLLHVALACSLALSDTVTNAALVLFLIEANGLLLLAVHVTVPGHSPDEAAAAGLHFTDS